jgi:hypothetical protein
VYQESTATATVVSNSGLINEGSLATIKVTATDSDNPAANLRAADTAENTSDVVSRDFSVSLRAVLMTPIDKQPRPLHCCGGRVVGNL